MSRCGSGWPIGLKREIPTLERFWFEKRIKYSRAGRLKERPDNKCEDATNLLAKAKKTTDFKRYFKEKARFG
jgi:hypothetical protein